jgi:hypothetical protein
MRHNTAKIHDRATGREKRTSQANATLVLEVHMSRGANGKRGDVIDPTGKSLICLSSPFCKNILIFRSANQVYIHSYPVPPRGAFRDRHERWCGMRWTQAVLKTRALNCGRRSRVVLTPRRWRQVCGVFRVTTVAKKPGHRGEREVSCKTIARGMPDVAGVT